MGYYKKLQLALIENRLQLPSVTRNRFGNWRYQVTLDAECSNCGKNEQSVMYAPGPYVPMVCESCQSMDKE